MYFRQILLPLFCNRAFQQTLCQYQDFRECAHSAGSMVGHRLWYHSLSGVSPPQSCTVHQVHQTLSCTAELLFLLSSKGGKHGESRCSDNVLTSPSSFHFLNTHIHITVCTCHLVTSVSCSLALN